MFNHLSTQKKIIIAMAAILAASLSVSFMAIFSYQKLQQTVLMEHETMIAYVEKTARADMGNEFDKMNDDFHRIITALSRQSLQVILTGTAIYILLGVMMAFFLARSVASASPDSGDGQLEKLMSAEDIAREMERLALALRRQNRRF